MVRGRRVRTLVASAKTVDCCDSPKRKDQRLEFPGKLSHTLISPKNQTITDFFHAVEEQDNKLQSFIKNCSLLNTNETNNKINDEMNHAVANINIVESSETIIVSSSTTPHRIELCNEQNLAAAPLPDPQIEFASKKAPPTKARRRLNVNQTSNQVLQVTSKDDGLNKNTVTSLMTNHTLTEYFPVRRSVRKTKRTVLEEKQKTLEQCIRNQIEEGLEVHNFSGKGRGVIASQDFCKGDFVVEYRGELIDMTEAKRREIQYAQDQNTGCYMYYFKHKNVQYCVDATAESGYLGRLVNHSRNGNLVTRTLTVDGRPRLVLIAKDDILTGEELTYDYGDRSKESLRYHPWLAT